MLIRTLAVASVVALSFGVAQAGQIANGAWTPTGCGVDPGKAPEIKSNTANAYNASINDAQTWQEKTKAYTECLVNEGKKDSGDIVNVINDHITNFNNANNEIAAASNEALKKVNKKSSGGAQSPHDK